MNRRQLTVSGGSGNKFSHCMFAIQDTVPTDPHMVAVSGGGAVTFEDSRRVRR